MAHTVEWNVVKTSPDDKVFDTVVDYWNDSVNDSDRVTQHLNNDSAFVLNKYSTLSGDRKSVTHTKTFASEDSYNEWLTAKNKLPAIDENLTITNV